METNTDIPSSCPSIEDLRAYLESAEAEIATHVELCRRCRALIRLLADEGRETPAAQAGSPEEVFGRLTRLGISESPTDADKAEDTALAEGSVVVAASPDAPGELLVAVVLDTSSEAASFDTVVVAPLSSEIRFAAEWDLVLDPGDTALGYAVIAELWNYGTLLRDQVLENRGVVREEGWSRIEALHVAVLGGEGVDEAQLPEGRGLPVVDDADPRVIFQDEEAERAGAFWKPAARVLSAGDGDTEAEGREAKPAEELLTVGAILNAWLEEQGYEVGEYAREIGFQRREVEAVCMDRIDPVTLSHDRVAKIIWRPHRDGGLDEDDLDAALGRSFIEDADWALVGAYGSERAYGRTAGLKGSERAEALRSGAAGSTPPLSAEERERRKKAYVREVLAALEEKAGS